MRHRRRHRPGRRAFFKLAFLFHWQTDCGLVLSTVFAGQLVGIREVEDHIWLVSFMDYDLGFFDNERGRVKPGPNPFAPDKVLTMCPE